MRNNFHYLSSSIVVGQKCTNSANPWSSKHEHWTVIIITNRRYYTWLWLLRSFLPRAVISSIDVRASAKAFIWLMQPKSIASQQFVDIFNFMWQIHLPLFSVRVNKWNSLIAVDDYTYQSVFNGNPLVIGFNIHPKTRKKDYFCRWVCTRFQLCFAIKR